MAPSRAVTRRVCSVFSRLSSQSVTSRYFLQTPASIRHAPSKPQRYIANQSSPLTFQRYQSSESAAVASSSSPEAPDYLSEGELHIFNKVKRELDPVKLEVQDISGGCGSMYALEIVSSKFKDLSMIKQHKLVNKILADEIKTWHGVQLRTRAE